jgi:SAM-dependent methyltransferase
MKTSHRLLHNPIGRTLLSWALALRTIPLIGQKHRCPCCNWGLRCFTKGARSFTSRPNGYCPRCNSKSRHRWLWLYLEEQTDVFKAPQRLLHVSPALSTGWAFRKLHHLDYVAGEIKMRPFVDVIFDLKQCPFPNNEFDTIICIHVLEHVDDDLPAIDEIHRILKPGGTAIIGVPVRMDKATYEDPSITSPQDRKIHFGEKDHWRFYGHDLIGRLENTGLKVDLVFAKDRPPHDIDRHGLKRDEVMFICRKLSDERAGPA